MEFTHGPTKSATLVGIYSRTDSVYYFGWNLLIESNPEQKNAEVRHLDLSGAQPVIDYGMGFIRCSLWTSTNCGAPIRNLLNGLCTKGYHWATSQYP